MKILWKMLRSTFSRKAEDPLQYGLVVTLYAGELMDAEISEEDRKTIMERGLPKPLVPGENEERSG